MVTRVSNLKFALACRDLLFANFGFEGTLEINDSRAVLIQKLSWKVRSEKMKRISESPPWPALNRLCRLIVAGIPRVPFGVRVKFG
jgi:hypothetical protein